MSQSRALFAALLLITVFTGVAEADGRAIVPVVGSTAGVNGANFRTEMQLHNPSLVVMRGSLMFLPQAAAPLATELAKLDYEIGPRQTLRYADAIAAMGASGLGSLDILPLEGGLPRVVVRAFDDQGNFGTRGLMVPVLEEAEATVIGFRFVLVAPSDIAKYRFNIGVRTLGESATMLRVVERDAAGVAVGDPISLTFPGETFRQLRANDFLGREVIAGHTFSFETLSGAAFVYATTVDNASNDGSLQLDRPVNRPPLINDVTTATDKNKPVIVLLSATDPDDDPMTWSVASAPSHGTVSDITISPAGIATKTVSAVQATITYTPATDYQGPDMFTVLVADDVNGRTFADIVINVGTETGDAPTAVNDRYTLNEGTTLTVPAAGVLTNDTDPEGNALVAQLVQGPTGSSSFTLNADGSFTYRPRTGFYGGDFFTYTASDGENVSNVAKVTLIINSTNQAPTAVDDVAATTEDVAIGIPVLANDSDPEGAPLTVSSVNTAGTLGAVSIGGGGVVNYDPTGSAALQALPAAATQIDTFAYTIRDLRGATDTATVTVTVTGVDDVPLAVADTATLLEDAVATAIPVLANDTDVDGGPMSIASVTQGTIGAVVITGGGSGLTYQPNADACGADSFTYTLNGGSVATVNVTVTCVNDVPSFAAGGDATVLEDSGAFTASPWATGVSAGPANESGQTLTFAVTNDNNALFSAQPSVNAAGDLTFTPAPNANGSAIVTVTLSDNGGTANGGVDTSAAQTFNITVTAVNDVPSFTEGADETVLEDTGLHTVAGWATAMSAGPADESGQTLTFNVTNDNNPLFSVQPSVDPITGALTYTLATDAAGVANVSVTLSDNGGTANGGVDTSAAQTFTITVTDVNDAPSFAAGGDATVLEDSGAFTASPWATGVSPGPASEAGQTLTFTVTNDNNALFSAQPAVNASGDLTFTPAANANGSAIVTVTLSDNGGTANGGVDTSASQTFNITVTAVNDVPSFTKGPDESVNEDTGLHTVIGWATGMSAGPANESGQILTFTVTNDNNPLFSVQPDVDETTGNLTYTLSANASGTTTVTVSLADDGGTLNGGIDTFSQTFTITVTDINDAPSFTGGADENVNEDSGIAGAHTVVNWATAISAGPSPFEDAQTLNFVIDTNDNPALFGVAPAISPTGTLTYTLAANVFGTATITLHLHDSGGVANGGVDNSTTDTLVITVAPQNDNPTAVDDTATVAEDSGATAVAVLANDDDAPDTGETLSITAVQNPSANGGTVLITGGGTGLTYQPALDFAGSDTFTYTIGDGNGGSATATVTMTVTAVNDAPLNTVPGVQSVDQFVTLTFSSGNGNAISIFDVDAATPQVTLAVDSGVLSLSGTAGLSFGSGDGTGDTTMTFTGTQGAINSALNGLVYDPVDTFEGAATLTITTNDLGQTGAGVALQDIDTVTINVTALNDPPVNALPAAQLTNEDTTLTLSTANTNTISISDPDAGGANVQVVLTATNGTMTLSGIAGLSFTVGDGTADPAMTFTGTIAAINTALDGLQFIPTANFAGGATLQIVTNDQGNTGAGGPQSDTDPLTITVNAVNDAPSGSDNTVTTPEDSQYTFAAADFPFADPTDSPANALSQVNITSLPAVGSLTLNGSGFAAGTDITVADIIAGLLEYAPAANASGSPYASFTFQVRDDGGTANGGVDLDPTPNTMTINVSPVNDAPAGTDTTVTGDEDVLYTFTAANFGFSDPSDSPANSLQSVVITTLPGAGSLTLSGGGFAAGTEISLANVTAGNLKFLGAANAFGSPYSTFTFQVRDNGGTASGGVDLDPTPNTMTINLNPINDAPTVINENGAVGQAAAWQTIGNTELRVDMVAGTTPNVSDTTVGASTYEGLIGNETDVEGDPFTITAIGGGCGDATAPFDCTLASGAIVHVDQNGEFSFTPGPADTTDTFTYTVTDTPGFGSPASAIGTVIINMSEMVWYVDPNVGGPGTGTSVDPFNNLDAVDGVGPGALTDTDAAGHYIFVHDGSLSRTTAMEMEANQHLVGEGFGLSIPVDLNGNGSPWVGLAAGTAPQITATASDTITVNTAIPIEIVGLSLASTTGNSIDLTTAAALSGSATLTIGNNEFRADGAEGIDVNLNASTIGTVDVNITNNSWNTAGTHTGNAIDVNRVAGIVRLNISSNTNVVSSGTAINIAGGAAASTTITGFANNTIHQNTGGSGIVVANATFDATPGGNFDVVSGGNTPIGVSGDGVGGAGMSLNPISGSVSFTDLDIYASNGAGLSVTGTGNIAAAAGTLVTIQNVSSSTIDATGGAAIAASTMTLNAVLNSIRSTNSAAAGVSLTNVADGTTNAVLTTGSGSSITNATGTDFAISGGNAAVTYNGTITDDVGQLVSVASATGDTISFTGAITDSDDGDGSGISLSSNTGATITFSGGVVLSTGANAAFAVTGGGTVNVCDENPCNAGATGALINKLTTTTGTALNVANTTIGANNLEFRSIASNGAANGISLNNTGGSGGLKVKGTGSAGSGGTIQSSTGPNVSLMTTSNVSLSWMIIQNGLDDGIHGQTVNNLDLINCTVNTNGNSTTDDGLQLGLPSGATTGITGTLNITNTSISGNAHNNVHIRNNNPVNLTAMNVSGSSFNNLNDTFGANAFLFEASGTSTVTAATISTSSFLNNSPQRALEVQSHDTATISDFTVNNNAFVDNGIHASFTQDTSSNLEFFCTNNHGVLVTDPITTTVLQVINVFTSSTSTGGTIVGTISGNNINTGGTNASGISAVIQGRAAATLLVNGNTIVGTAGARGISLAFRGPTSNVGPASVNDVTVINNNVNNGLPAIFPAAAISVEADNQSGAFAAAPTVRADIRLNTVPSTSCFDFGTGCLQFFEYDGDGTPSEFQDGIGQLVDTAPASANADAQLSSTNTGSVYTSGITLIAGPINTPP